MDFLNTRHQVARGTRPDGERRGEYLLIKNVGTLRATYQIRLLVFLALQRGYRITLRVPNYFKPAPSLARLLKEHPGVVKIEKVS
jgi:hypothetical protein